MATKTVGSSGDYTNFGDYQSYLDALNALSEAETGKIQSGEFNGGGLTLTGFTPSATYPYTLTCDDGAKFTGNPLRYTDGARILFDTNGEGLVISVPYVTVKDLAIRGSVNGTICISLAELIDNLTLQNVICECSSTNGRPIRIGNGTGHVIENTWSIRRSNGSDHYTHAWSISSTGSATFKNCGAISLATSSGTEGGFGGGGTGHTMINCVSYGFAVDYGSSGWNASSTNNATSKASGSSNCPSTNAQYEVPSGDFTSLIDGSHDLRVTASATKLKNNGHASSGTATDIIGNAASGTRDIGPHEYQAANSKGYLLLQGAFV